MRKDRISICPKCLHIKDKRAKQCKKCFLASGDMRRGTGKGYYYVSGYKKIHRKNHPYADGDGFVREHRLIMEEYLKCYLDPRKHHVHHLNEIRDDNRLENLALVSHSEHIKKYHNKLARKK